MVDDPSQKTMPTNSFSIQSSTTGSSKSSRSVSTIRIGIMALRCCESPGYRQYAYASILTPLQKATRPVMPAAAGVDRS